MIREGTTESILYTENKKVDWWTPYRKRRKVRCAAGIKLGKMESRQWTKNRISKEASDWS